MTKKILVPLDNSEISKELVRIADEWAKPMAAELLFLHVQPVMEMDVKKQREQFENLLKDLKISAQYHAVFRTGVSYQEIMSVAKEFDPNLIIMGAHSHTVMGQLFLGSNTRYVLHHCTCPVFVYKQQKLLFENKIVVPIDYTEVNRPVIALADEMALRTDAELNFIRVEQYPEPYLKMETPLVHPFPPGGFFIPGPGKYQKEESAQIRGMIDSQATKLESFIKTSKVKARYKCMIHFGKSYRKILELQKYINARLIMIAAHSHTTFDRLLSGSNTDYLLQHSECPMYVYKGVE